MNKYSVKAAACALVGTLSLSGYQMTLEAKIHNLSDMPAAGVAVVLDEGSTIQDLQVEVVQNIAYLESASGLQPNIIKASERVVLADIPNNVVLSNTKTTNAKVSAEFTQEISEAISEVESEILTDNSAEDANKEETQQEKTLELSTELLTEWEVPEQESTSEGKSEEESSDTASSNKESSGEEVPEESSAEEGSDTESTDIEGSDTESADTESSDTETSTEESSGTESSDTETSAEESTDIESSDTEENSDTETSIQEGSTEESSDEKNSNLESSEEDSDEEDSDEETAEEETFATETDKEESSEEGTSSADTENNDFQTSAGFSATDTYDDIEPEGKNITETAVKAEEKTEEDSQDFSGLVIAQVTNYVNVRSTPGEDGEVVGKLYANSVGEFVEEEDGWYKIVSGNCTGYVKGEFCVAGKEAEELAKEVGTTYAVVNTTTLKVRQDASTESAVLGLVPINEELVVLEELDGWVKIAIEEGDGYVSKDYINLRTDFVHAESKEEEAVRLAKEAKAREEARAAAAATEAARLQKQAETQAQKTVANQAAIESARSTAASSEGSEMGKAVIDYATQFVGNPYVYGGTSLTNGADCSGFVMSVYSNFGVSLPHSSSALRNQGYDVGGLSNAQPGDIVCYSGHVGLYVGNGQIVHASTSKTGIIVSNASYRNILSVRRIF